MKKRSWEKFSEWVKDYERERLKDFKISYSAL